MQDSRRPIDVLAQATPITPAIGVEISGIDLSLSLSESVQGFLRELLAQHAVISIRDQTLTPEQQVALAKVFGEPVSDPHPKFGSVEGHSEVSVVVNDEDNPPDINVWHTDLTFRAEPGKACVLYCRELPDAGGDTLWASSAAAWDGLAAPLQAMLESLEAVHRIPVEGYSVEQIATLQNREHEVVHPIVRVHESTGRRCLFVNSVYTREILGLGRSESGHLLNLLFEHLARPEYQMRYRWRPGSVVIWDNLQTQHYAVADYYPHRRVMHRVALQ